ncbi:MAG TPA: ComEA family DNA-binding protein [Gaiellaceae bacterium]|nr:ComEA family DNA-binding protein [Gaiellaceae bacterium]
MPFAVSRSTALVGVCIALAALALLGQRLAHAGAASEPEPVATALEPVAAAPVRSVLVVHVVGEVRRPGLYRLREGSRIADAVHRAGGALRDADLSAVNLAAPLVDGIQVAVPARVAEGAAPSASAGVAGAGGAPTAPLVSLSAATLDQLDELPGVGPVTAQKIVDYRTEHGPFASVDDLDAVPGIGPTRIEQLRELVTP